MSERDDLVARLSESHVLTTTLYGEARGELVEGQIAVACVIRNRVETGRWGRTYKAVCLAPWQFSTWTPEGGQENYALTIETAQQLASGVLPSDPLVRQCAWIAHGIIDRWLVDTVRRSTHYYAPLAMKPVGAVPKWAVGLVPAATKGRHLFFSGVK